MSESKEKALTPGKASRDAAGPDTRRNAVLCAQWLLEKKADNIIVYHVADHFQIADYFVIATGKAPRQMKGMAAFLRTQFKAHGIKTLGLEGQQDGRWILYDAGDVVVHLMLPDVRAFYDLDHLWGDCPKVSWDPETK